MRRAALAGVLFLLAGLSGCGFQPVYSREGSGLGKVSVAEIEGRTGYFLRTELNRLSALEQTRPQVPQLTVSLLSTYRNASFQANTFADRTLLEVTATWSLVDGDQTLRGEVKADTGFDNREEAYSGMALQAEAEERIAPVLARAIWNDIRLKRGVR